MVRLRNAVMAIALGTGVMGCALSQSHVAHYSIWHCDECDDFPTPAYGPGYSMMPGTYTALGPRFSRVESASKWCCGFRYRSTASATAHFHAATYDNHAVAISCRRTRSGCGQRRRRCRDRMTCHRSDSRRFEHAVNARGDAGTIC